MTDSPSQRLNKYLALATGSSRRQADEWIAAGRVRLNDEPASLGAQVTANDVVMLDDTPLATDTELLYIALHKPAGYVCSRKKQGDSDTIYTLLPEKYHHLKPVGRLDRDSSGLLLMTNDGDFAHRMTHPSFHKTKTYEVSLDTPLAPLHQQMISDYGVMLEDGKSQLTLERLGDEGIEWKVAMHEGRNRQIRRTFAALGYTVTKLHRTQFGQYALDDTEPGNYSQFTI